METRFEIKSASGAVLYADEGESVRHVMEKAVRSDANLAGAYLYGANLYGANLAGANLGGANLYGANLAGANLAGANLYGANLAGAKIGGANLAGAYLAGAKIKSVPGNGFILGYDWLMATCEEGEPLLKYGCELRRLGDWEANVTNLCLQHEPERAQEYERALRALLVLCRSVTRK